jgi:spore coat protein U-like protein
VVTNAQIMRAGIRTAAVLLASASFGVASMASAQTTDSNNITIAAAVVPVCHVGVGSLDFTNVDVTLNQNKDITGTVNVKCTVDTTYKLTADAGTGTGATTATRVLTGATPANTLNYTLYTDSAHTNVWGNDATVTAETIGGTGTGVDVAKSFYGRVFSGQTGAKVDTYSDTISVTVTY